MASPKVIPLIVVAEGGKLPDKLTPLQRKWANANGFRGQRGRLLALPGGNGGIAGYLFGAGPSKDRPTLVTGLAAASLEPGR